MCWDKSNACNVLYSKDFCPANTSEFNPKNTAIIKIKITIFLSIKFYSYFNSSIQISKAPVLVEAKTTFLPFGLKNG